jgi:hypothetical protein
MRRAERIVQRLINKRSERACSLQPVSVRLSSRIRDAHVDAGLIERMDAGHHTSE